MVNIYMIADELPVKRLDRADGGFDFFVWNFETAEFERKVKIGWDLINGYEPDSDGRERTKDSRIVNEAEFNEIVENLRQEKLREDKDRKSSE